MRCASLSARGPSQSAGSSPARIAAVRAVVDAGVAVMGHVGLTPQSISALGGFRPQGRSAESALQIVRDAKVSVHNRMTVTFEHRTYAVVVA